MNSVIAQSRFPGVSYVIVAINVLIFVAELFNGGHLMSPSTQHLVAWGANVGPLTLSGESWRLLTSMFLHIGLLHLAMNMYMLVLFGPVVERQFGAVRFTLVYLISGMFGGLASALLHSSPGNVVTAAGASGALMGISGAFLGHWLLAAARHQAREAMNMRGPLAQTVGLTLLLGVINPAIDNAAHIGGLVAGALIGGAYSLASFEHSALKRAAATVAIAIASLVALNVGVNATPSPELTQFRAYKQAEEAARAGD
jgi:rhomboid protease GluP